MTTHTLTIRQPTALDAIAVGRRRRRSFLFLFLAAWALNLAALAGYLGPTVQAVFAVLALAWLWGLYATHRAGLLLPCVRFWLTVMGVRRKS